MSGHRKPAHARHRTDAGSAELIELLEAHGIEYEPLGGTIDGVAWWRGQCRLIDFKAKEKSPLTARQGKLLARGCPIAFVWTADQVRLLARDMKQQFTTPGHGIPRATWETTTEAPS